MAYQGRIPQLTRALQGQCTRTSAQLCMHSGARPTSKSSWLPPAPPSPAPAHTPAAPYMRFGRHAFNNKAVSIDTKRYKTADCLIACYGHSRDLPVNPKPPYQHLLLVQAILRKRVWEGSYSCSSCHGYPYLTARLSLQHKGHEQIMA
jgi:hypothetical protein